jgi:multidrug efflux system membrane fusion protein
MKQVIKGALLALVVIAVGYVLYTRLAPHGAPGGGMEAQGGAPTVDVAPAIERDVRVWSDFSGRLVAADQADIRPRVSGAIDSVLFTNGARVNKDDLLFIIDPRPYKATLEQAQSALTAAKATADLAKTEFERGSDLLKTKAVSQSEYDKRKSDYDAATAARDSAQAALDLAQVNLDYTQVKAPIAGRVGRAEITEGNIVESGAGAPVLTTVVADDPIYADFEMDEASYLRYSRGGQDAGAIPVMMGLSSDTGTPHEGKIEAFDNRLDASSGTIRVRAVFDNKDGALVPGLFARVRIGGEEKPKAVLINDQAVGTDQDKKFVLVVGDDGKVEYRVIKPGVMVDGLRVVDDGLKAGEKIIVSGLQRARPGMNVTAQTVDMEHPDAPPAAANKITPDEDSEEDDGK